MKSNRTFRKETLGLWSSETEGAKFWLSVLTELQNRGVCDVLIACVDGLKGFPEAIETVFPKTLVQICIVHQIRNSLNFVSCKDLKAVAADLKPIYTAATLEEAVFQLELFAGKWDKKYPLIAKSWRNNWSRTRADVSVSVGNTAGDLHDERHRIAEYEFAENHENASGVSNGRSSLQVALARIAKHRTTPDNAD